MDDDASRLMEANRVSIAAVLVGPADDSVRAMLDSGILDPVTVPFVLDNGTPNGGTGLGDGITPNIMATLDPTNADTDAADHDPGEQDEPAPSTARPATTATLAAAYGMVPLAPVRKRQL